jgi:photosystem II stability/assembly factor-like uncharacterized protein
MDMRTHQRLLCLLGTLVFLGCLKHPGRLMAQESDPRLYSEMKWRMIGPFRGGRVLAVQGVPGNPAVYYFAANGGGVWKTTDGGTVWKPVFDDAPVQSIGALALAPFHPDIVYVGTGEDSLHSQISYGNGVYRSDDGGHTWQHRGLDDTHHIGKILVDPKNPDVVLVAALGHVYSANEERGVFRSTDGGKTWTKTLYKDDQTGAIDLAADPDNPKTVFATMWHGVRKPWGHGTSIGPGGGIYKSQDGGVTWKQLTGGGLPAGDLGRIGVVVGPGTSGRRVYAIIEAKKDGGLYRSDDGGTTWQRSTTDERISGVWFFGQIFVDPHNADIIYIPETSINRSTDGGKTFTAIKGAPGGDDYHVLWIDPQNTSRMILGCDQGASISVDGGTTWSSWYNQPTAQFYHVATDHRFPYHVYGAQQDSGTVGTASRGDYGQITERDWYPVGPGESGYTLPDPLDPEIVYNAGPGGIVVRYFHATGQTQDVSPAPIPLGSKERFNWTIPLAFSPQDPHVLYLGSQFLLMTTDAGTNWKAISPDLTLNPADTSDGKDKGTVYTIAPSPLREGVIWVGTNNGLVQLTKDDGATWTNVTPAGLAPWSQISLIEASHFDPFTAYAAVNGREIGDMKPHILRTRDAGKTWQETVAGIRDVDFVRAVREDPLTKGLLFAGTETSVYFSTDDGDHWASLQMNLPSVSVRDLAIEQDDLVAGTHGRSFWVLDDITPLRQLKDQPRDAAFILYKPRPAMRVRRDENQDTPLPPEIPAANNPPDGAIINYVLGNEPGGDISLDIYDESGNLMRHFKSNEPAQPEEPEPFVPKFWIAPPQKLSKSAGMHRFVWNMRYADPQAMHPNSPYAYPIAAIAGATPQVPQGPMVLPGVYKVVLTVNNQMSTQALEVKMDPRVSYARNDLARQRDLELAISALLEKDFSLQGQVMALRAWLASIAKLSAPDSVVKASAALDAKAAAMEGGPADLLAGEQGTSTKGLNDALTALMGEVDGADLAPTSQSFRAFESACQELNTNIKKWEMMKKDDLTGLNALLVEQKISTISNFPAIAPTAGCEAK